MNFLALEDHTQNQLLLYIGGGIKQLIARYQSYILKE
jgi:hypothetical protein